MKTKLDETLIRDLSGEMTPKFLATADAQGTPNVVPIISITPWDDGTVIFGNFLMWKTERNLAAYPKAGIAVMTEELKGAVILGDFRGFQKTGRFVDAINSQKNFRYNAYTGIRSAGEIAVRSVSEPFSYSKLDVLAGNARSAIKRVPGGLSSGNVVMNPVVMEKFQRLAAVKVLAFIDRDGYPVPVVLMSLRAAAPDVLVFRKAPMGRYMEGLADGAPVAVSVITFDPVAFQVKGVYSDLGASWGAVRLTEAFHASPPFPGRKIA